MSQLPCFYTLVDGVHIFFSLVEDWASLNVQRFSINWDCIKAQATNGDYLTRETALNGISELQCGECMELSGEQSSLSAYWTPNAVARSESIDDFSQAASELRSKVQLCVDGWALTHDRILLSLSGGLDSSIVLSCLKRAPNKPDVRCFTLYSRLGVGDERQFARCMANAADTPLIEIERSPHIDLSIFFNCAKTARPVMSFSDCDVYQKSLQMARETRSSAIFDGELGDNVFGVAAGHDLIKEHIATRGLRSGLLNVALDYAHLKKLSVWRALYLGIRDSVFSEHQSHWSSHLSMKRSGVYDPLRNGFVTAEVLEEYGRTLNRFIHPWLRDMHGVPAGRRQLIHALAIAASTPYHPPFAAAGDLWCTSPLTGQPVVECALRIASELHVKDGRNRSIARHAFRHSLPELILKRGGKGGPGMWVRDVIEQNRGFLREALLGGVLVRERILDRAKVETALSGEVGSSGVVLSEIFTQLYIEAWVRNWDRLQHQAAA
jgi:asparagine synthase (glutamine-hydrolysing)